MQIDWWSLDFGCVKKNMEKEAWIRVVELPFHLWTIEILSMIGDSYGGFVEVDHDTTLRTKTMWARLLVRLEGTKRSSMVNILEGLRSFELQVWWELLP